MAKMEQTLVIIKPDAVQRGLIGEIVGRFERRGLKVTAMRFEQIGRDVAGQHYAEHQGKPFYDGLVDYITSSPSVLMVLAGPGAIQATRNTIGATRPVEAAMGTIRADLALEVGRNLVHGSDGPEAATREIDLFFGDGGVVDYERSLDRWVLE